MTPQDGSYQFQGGPPGYAPQGTAFGPKGYSSAEVAKSEQSFLTKVFGWMALGLAITFAIALMFQSQGAKIAPWLWPAIFIQLGIAIGMGFGLRKLSAGAVTALYLVYCAVTGFTFAVLFAALAASGQSAVIWPAFLATAGTFGLMALIGATTKMDLSKFGAFLFFALIGIVIVSLLGIFINATAITWIVMYGGLLVFMGLTVYEVWALKNKREYADMLGPAGDRKLAVYGAFSLYLNFINIFIRMLYILGGSRS
ncbi:MAG: Bax inhibitor-1/YccA family protein [Acidimicrobiia bacterium]|nr:Bax inhibitor-1/YccA family protein [Acidimicrobiia bacterium]